jgi:hypothetical protein
MHEYQVHYNNCVNYQFKIYTQRLIRRGNDIPLKRVVMHAEYKDYRYSLSFAQQLNVLPSIFSCSLGIIIICTRERGLYSEKRLFRPLSCASK